MLEAQTARTTVTVDGFIPGDPPKLAWHKRLRGPGGREKVVTQLIEVRDHQLFSRLQREAKPGSQIQVTLVTDWSQPGAPTFLTSFTGIGASAQPAP